MASKYIDMEAFKKKYVCFGWTDCISEEELDAFPAADVKPVRHGAWVRLPYCDDILGIIGKCSLCGETEITGTADSMGKFCRNCGAKMDGGNQT